MALRVHSNTLLSFIIVCIFSFKVRVRLSGLGEGLGLFKSQNCITRHFVGLSFVVGETRSTCCPEDDVPKENTAESSSLQKWKCCQA